MQWFSDHWPIIPMWLVTVVTSIGAVRVMFRYFGERIVGHVFDRKLELFKHERVRDLEQFKHPLNQEIERLRGDIGHLFDRGKHSNEREYVGASMLWEKAVDLYFATNMCVISYIECPSLNAMPQEELVEFLNTTEFNEPQKRLVLEAKDKERSFSHITGRRYISAALSEVSLMNGMLHKQGIFVPTELCSAFESFKELCIRAIVQRRTEHGENFRTGFQHDLEFLSQGSPHLEVVKIAVRTRLLRE
jgi:hypothetical protein